MTDIAHLLFKEFEFKKRSEKDFKEIIELYESLHNLFLISADESRKKYEESADMAFHKVYLMTSMKINSDSRSIFHSTIAGWYTTAISLFREIQDTFLKIIFITNFPDRAQTLLDNKINTRNIKNELKNNGIRTPLKEKDMGILSQIKHGELQAIMAYGEEKGNVSILRFYPIYNPLMPKLILLQLIDYLIWILEHFIHFFRYRYNLQFAKTDFINCFEKLRQDRNNMGDDYSTTK